MQRIVLFHPAFLEPGGAEFLCINQAQRLAARGFEVRVVTFAYDAKRWAKEFNGIELVAVRKRSWKDSVLGWNRGTKLKYRGRRAARFLQDADVIVAHNSPCNLMLGSQSLSARRIWQCNEPPRNLHRRLANPRLTERVESAPEDASDFATAFWRNILDKDTIDVRDHGKRTRLGQVDIQMTQQLDSVYAISEFSRDNARKIYGLCDEEVVYPFVRFPKGGKRSGPIAEDGLQVLVQTRLEMLKHVDAVIRGFAQYRATDPKATLHIVGDGPLRNQLQELALDLMPPEACLIHGYLSTADLRAVYDRCDVFALLTLDEPFGMVYPEAAARGLLMVGPDHGGPLEILEGGAIGHCIDPFEPAALVQALEELRALSTSEVESRRAKADRSCRARFGDEVIEASLLRSLGQFTSAAK
ncbi:MAG: glycosyltransferase involved in cell wall biosynthesis [Planctomycetota bacterium]